MRPRLIVFAYALIASLGPTPRVAHAGWGQATRQFIYEHVFLSADQRWVRRAREQMARDGTDHPAFRLLGRWDTMYRVATDKHLWYVPGNRYFEVAVANFPEKIDEVQRDCRRLGLRFPAPADLLRMWYPPAIAAESARRRAEIAARAEVERTRRQEEDARRRAKRRAQCPTRRASAPAAGPTRGGERRALTARRSPLANVLGVNPARRRRIPKPSPRAAGPRAAAARPAAGERGELTKP